MYKIFFSKNALDDIKIIKDFISKDNPDLSGIVVDKILLTISVLSIFPLLGKEIDKSDGLRELVESNYHFRIIYQISINSINIISIFKYRNN